MINIKTKMLCLVSVLAVGLCSCKNVQNTDNNSKINFNNDSSHFDSILEETETEFADGSPMYTFESRYEYLQNKYPNKTILVWINFTDVKYENEVNEFLDSEGKNYAVCFKNPCSDNISFNDTYWSCLNKIMKSNEQPDIIFSGLTFTGEEGYRNSYQKCVYNGWFEPLDTYLNKTKSGKKLQNLMPDKYWDSLKINNKIYGFDGSLTCLKETAGLMYNANLIDKKQIKDYDSFKSQIIDAIKACKSKKLSFNTPVLFYPESYTNNDFINDFLYLDNNKKFNNFYESDEAKELFNIIANGYNDKVIYNALLQRENITINEMYANSITMSFGALINNKVKTSKSNGLIDDKQKTAEGYMVFPEYDENINPSSMAVGINVNSKNKDLAFDALAKIMSNKELNNLICYGSEDKALDNSNDSVGIKNELFDMANKDEKKLKRALENLENSELTGIPFDFSKVTEQYNKIDEIVGSIDENFPSPKYKTGEEYLKELNKKLYDAGLQDVIDEANRQLDEFYKDKF